MSKSKSSTGIKKTAKKAVAIVAPQKTAKKLGRPANPNITPDTIEKIFELMREGTSFNKSCQIVKLPRVSVLDVINADKSLYDKYARSKQEGLEYKLETIYERIENSKDVQKDRLFVDTLKWHISKVLPKLYGDKLQVSADVKADVKASVSGDFVALFLKKFKGGDKC